jgi:hypothetical protein
MNVVNVNKVTDDINEYKEKLKITFYEYQQRDSQVDFILYGPKRGGGGAKMAGAISTVPELDEISPSVSCKGMMNDLD